MFTLNLISVIGSICSILTFFGITHITLSLHKKIRAEIYRDDNKKTVELYIYCLNTDVSWFAKSKNLKNSNIFKQKGHLSYFEDREIGDEEFDGKRKGQFQTQYISFFKSCVKHAVEKYIGNLEDKQYELIIHQS